MFIKVTNEIWISNKELKTSQTYQSSVKVSDNAVKKLKL